MLQRCEMCTAALSTAQGHMCQEQKTATVRPIAVRAVWSSALFQASCIQSCQLTCNFALPDTLIPHAYTAAIGSHIYNDTSPFCLRCYLTL